ncbi:hypothetical protein C8A00DRAFT_29677 [Chaetomidium leptoderma]|uniref:Uncharacterized protein n=1 Tax=Chaetomidium leptoderma TaxID=669021 RepID=A0AAN7A0X0_9PEZI|nr:hypothetical protein C8A00DRAFT_29677 [Chaetomidium leptoderma]
MALNALLSKQLAEAEAAKQLAEAEAAKQRRRLFAIDKLTNEEDWPRWNERFLCVLKRAELDKYVLEEVPEPEGDEDAKNRWSKDRVEIDDYILSLIPEDDKTWQIMRCLGWNPAVPDPKKTYDTLELAAIRRETFNSMSKYQERINDLRERLGKTDFGFVKDSGYIWCAIKGIQKEYPDLHNRMAIAKRSDNLSWADLMAEFQQIAITENTHTASSR